MLYDKDIREPLFEYLEETVGKIRIIEEKNMGNSRADAFMVLEHDIAGIEIKSDADTYARLKRQVKDYDTYFDYNIIAAGSRHAYHIAEHIPEWWGIITIDEINKRPDFYMYRQPKPNPNVQLAKQITLLWRPELAHIQEVNNLPAYKEKSKLFVMEKILEKLEPSVIKKCICCELFERDYNSIADTINSFRQEEGKRKRRRKKRYRARR